MSFSSPSIANYIYTLLSLGKYNILVGPLNLLSHKNFSSYLYFYSSVFRAREDFTVKLCNPRQRHVLKPLMMYYTLLCSVFMKVEEKPRTRHRHATIFSFDPRGLVFEVMFFIFRTRRFDENTKIIPLIRTTNQRYNSDWDNVSHVLLLSHVCVCLFYLFISWWYIT